MEGDWETIDEEFMVMMVKANLRYHMKVCDRLSVVVVYIYGPQYTLYPALDLILYK